MNLPSLFSYSVGHDKYSCCYCMYIRQCFAEELIEGTGIRTSFSKLCEDNNEGNGQ